jgi:hypothetical protein
MELLVEMRVEVSCNSFPAVSGSNRESKDPATLMKANVTNGRGLHPS